MIAVVKSPLNQKNQRADVQANRKNNLYHSFAFKISLQSYTPLVPNPCTSKKTVHRIDNPNADTDCPK